MIMENLYIYTEKEIERLTNLDNWNKEDLNKILFFQTKLEISGKLFMSYDKNTKLKLTNELISIENHLSIFNIIYKLFKQNLANSNLSVSLKEINALLKLKDFISKSLPNNNLDILNSIDKKIMDFLNSMDILKQKVTFDNFDLKPYKETKVADLIVLYWESPIARAYLSIMRYLNIKPKKIIYLTPQLDISTKKRAGQFLPTFFRIKYLNWLQKKRINHWVKYIQKNYKNEVDSFIKQVSNDFEIEEEYIHQVYSNEKIETYSDEIEFLEIENLNDSRLFEYFKKLDNSQIIFTGGGILPAKIFELKHIKFIHTHPGFLPDVRGADCTLWSKLIYNAPSASCFYMTPNIDDGDVILKKYLKTDHIDNIFSELDYSMQYRAIFSFLDPWIRAVVLGNAFIKTNLFTNIETNIQDDEISQTFYFMHSELKKYALTSYCKLNIKNKEI